MSIFRNTRKPFLIAGPCSAETRAQVLQTAEALQSMPVHLFRAGIWKPRTRPGHFEGVGEESLKWLQEVKQEYSLRTTVEVAEPEHVEAALKWGVDVLWIGARTTVNPFAVQRLADAMQGISNPVMVKNPVNPDVDLWLGAIERIQRAGVGDIAAIHRGFSTYKASSVYRNAPNWPVPIELRRRRPDLPIICDPSHITGARDLVAEVSQKAMDMGFDGLMIETHPAPDEAWSDAAQQVTPAALRSILADLIIRSEHSADDDAEELDYLRQLMDSVDAEIIDLLARRGELSKRLGAVKKVCHLTAYQPERWREIVDTRGEQATQKKLSADFVVEIFKMIHDDSVARQIEILNAAEDEGDSETA